MEPRAEVTVAGYQTVPQRNLTCAIRIRERRRELGLTQAEVVERVSSRGSRLSNQALSAIENGRRLAVGRLPDLADALDCTVTYLLGLTADPHRWTPGEQAGPRPGEQAGPRPGEQAGRPAAAPLPRPRGPAGHDPVRSSRRSWILGPDVPGIPEDTIQGNARETQATQAAPNPSALTTPRPR